MLIDRYANIIRGQFYGHTHVDTYQIFPSITKGEIAGVALEHPSLTTYTDLHPSYRVYKMDSPSFVLKDFEVYRLNITEVNINDKPEWKLSYRFKEYYNVTDMKDTTFLKIAENIRINDDIFKKYAKMLYQEGPQSDKFMKDTQKKEEVYKGILGIDFEKLVPCSEIFNPPFNFEKIYVFYTDCYLPQWEYAINE